MAALDGGGPATGIGIARRRNWRHRFRILEADRRFQLPRHDLENLLCLQVEAPAVHDERTGDGGFGMQGSNRHMEPIVILFVEIIEL